MAIPVPIPSGARPVVDAETVRAEAFVALLTQVMKSGTSGGTASIGTPAMLIPEGMNPPIDPATGKPKLTPVIIDTPQAQLWYRQIGVVLSQLVPLWASTSGPSLGKLVFNETPIGSINGSNKIFTTANVFIASSTRLYYNGQRLHLGVDYIESPGGGGNPPLNAGLIFTSSFPAPRTGAYTDVLVVDYVKV